MSLDHTFQVLCDVFVCIMFMESIGCSELCGVENLRGQATVDEHSQACTKRSFEVSERFYF